MSRFQTDSLNPTALNSGVLGRKRAAGPSTHSFLDADITDSNNPDAARDKFAADWNSRIDKEMRAVSGGLKELVELADIGTQPPPHTATPASLHLKIRTAQLIRATQSIRDMAHELRLMLLLADENAAAARRDAEAADVRAEAAEGRRRVLGEVRRLMRGQGDVGGVGEVGEEGGDGDEPRQGQRSGEQEGATASSSAAMGAVADATATRPATEVAPASSAEASGAAEAPSGGMATSDPATTATLPAPETEPSAGGDASTGAGVANEDDDSDDFEEL